MVYIDNGEVKVTKRACAFTILLSLFVLITGCAGPLVSGDPKANPASGMNTVETTDEVRTGNAEAIQKMDITKESLSQLKLKVDKSQFKIAGDISSKVWINSKPLQWQALRGKVVVVDFWTFACYNCKNTLPYKKAWYSKYQDQGLVILGVHTPELSFERDVENVRQAVKDYGIEYPIAIDGDFANWNRYEVWAWPTWFVVDKEGYIRYSHVGEGDYARSEQVIRELLAE